MLFQRRYRPLIGLDITTSSIKLIELTRSGDTYRVESYAAEPSPANAINEKAIVDAQAVGDAVRRATKRAGARSKDCAVAVSGDAAITKVIQMPRNLRDSELESQVEMQADQYIPFPMEEVSFDFEVVGPSEKDPEMLDVLLVATTLRERRAAPGGRAGRRTHRAHGRRRGVRARKRLPPADAPDARRRHGAQHRGRSTSAPAAPRSRCCAT